MSKGFVLILVSSMSMCAALPAAPSRPNIIFMMADDLGYGDLGCYGQEVIQTPNIDRLAREGMRFTQCYAGSTVCAPSRSVLMTGLHTGHTRVRGNSGKVGGVGAQRRVPLEPGDVTVAEVLGAAGYTTGMTGKWGLGEPRTTGEPNSQGFDEWFGYLNQRNAHSYYPPYLWRNREKVMLEGNRDKKKGDYSHDLISEFALDFIRRHHDKPFFLYLPWCIPHARYEIPSVAPYEDRPWKDNEKVHAAMVTRMDRDVGRLMKLLDKLGIDRHTIVFFCSDNGAASRWEKRFDSSGILRGRKRDMYEGGIRTPMVVRWPDKIPAGVVNETVWSFVDFLPTAADLAGLEVLDGLDGISLLPTLLGGVQDLDERPLYWEFYERGFQQAVRLGRWKAIRLKPAASLELYDLASDPGEARDVAASHPAVISNIEGYLRRVRTASLSWPSPVDVR